MPETLHVPIDPAVARSADLAARDGGPAIAAGAMIAVAHRLRTPPATTAAPEATGSPTIEHSTIERVPPSHVGGLDTIPSAPHATASAATHPLPAPHPPSTDPPVATTPSSNSAPSLAPAVTNITNIGVQYSRTPADRADNTLSRAEHL